MARVVLQDRQRALLQEERHIATGLQECLGAFDSEEIHLATLRQITETLDHLFLLVVVGEFNAGKSACINALLREKVLEEGVIPTTYQPTIVQYGQQRSQSQQAEGVLELYCPADILHDISIVDTPGISAIQGEPEGSVKSFISRSDLILFVTAADRSFSQNERAFLEHIRAWKKKLVIVLNKIDLLPTPGTLEDTIRFIRADCERVLGFQPEIFPVSALLSRQAGSAVGHGAVNLWESSRVGELESHLCRTLYREEYVRLKLLSMLGVMSRLIDTAQQAVEQQDKSLTEDTRTVFYIETQVRFYREYMTKNVQYRLSDIEKVLQDMCERGDRFFARIMRLDHISNLVYVERIRDEFCQEVIGDSAQRVDYAIQDMIGWIVEQEHQLRQHVITYLSQRQPDSLRHDGEASSTSQQIDDDRRAVLQSVARSASAAVRTYDHQVEANEISSCLRSTVMQMAVAGVSGVGLGVVLVATMGTALADLSGVLAGAMLLGLGLCALPLRHRQIRQRFDEQMQRLQVHLRSVVGTQIDKELQSALNRLQDAIAPYTQAVHMEQQKTEAIRTQAAQLSGSLLSLRDKVERLRS
ncbi:MAG: dynamin family protein [Ktedonobacteraceae bacterium]|nr:dynamin family protein [Ktedonobacteraceae bacterium]MBO0789706.1 dynamin family protein [Ktedonobacteraceae bacterium]